MARPVAIRPVSSERNFIRWLLYGEPGCGKSALAGTSPRALILASDGEEPLSAARFGSKADMWVCDDCDELEKAYEYVRHGGVKDYDWIWIDNGTLLQEQNMDTIMSEVTITGKRSPYVPDKPQYLINQNQLGRLIRMFKALPIHFGMTAHVMTAYDRNGDEKIMPMFQGGQGVLSQKFCGYMNIVSFMDVRRLKGGAEERFLLTGKRSNMIAKDRYHSLGSRVVDPNVPAIMEAIRANLPTLGQRAPVKRVAPTKAAATKKAAPTKATATTKKAPAKAAAANKRR